MNSLLLKRAGFMAALALASSLAAADPVTPTDPLTFKDQKQISNSGAFRYTYDFTLSSGALFYGSLTATSGFLGNVTVDSLLLSNGTTEYLFDTLGDGHDFASLVSSTTTQKNGRLSATLYVDTFSWDSVFLAAGDWTVTVLGSDIDHKAGAKLDLLLVDPPASVPEPASWALAGLALAAMVFAGRRRAS